MVAARGPEVPGQWRAGQRGGGVERGTAGRCGGGGVEIVNWGFRARRHRGRCGWRGERKGESPVSLGRIIQTTGRGGYVTNGEAFPDY